MPHGVLVEIIHSLTETHSHGTSRNHGVARIKRLDCNALCVATPERKKLIQFTSSVYSFGIFRQRGAGELRWHSRHIVLLKRISIYPCVLAMLQEVIKSILLKTHTHRLRIAFFKWLLLCSHILFGYCVQCFNDPNPIRRMFRGGVVVCVVKCESHR